MDDLNFRFMFNRIRLKFYVYNEANEKFYL